MTSYDDAIIALECGARDAELWALEALGENVKYWRAPLRSIDDAVHLVNCVLPGWFWRVASCHVSDDAFVAPDYNCPIHGDRLKREYPMPGGNEWTDITDVDLRPPGSPATALVISLLIALKTIEEQHGDTA